MNIQEKIEIIIPTYNRAALLKETLHKLLEKESPVKNCRILVLDNNSTDTTGNLVKEFQQKHPNIHYIKNHYNIGIGGNIARALELASLEYLWLLGDDDIIFWDAWPEVEKAILKGEKVICAANYTLQKGEGKSIPALLLQMSFISCNILHTSVFNDTEMSNIINNIYTLFPHLPPTIAYINQGHTPYLLPKPLVTTGTKPSTDVSYIRGYDNKALYLKQRTMSWIVGYANVMAQIEKKKLKYQIIARSVQPPFFSWGELYMKMFSLYVVRGNFLPVLEVCRMLPWWKRIFCWLPIAFYQLNESNAWYIFFFGLKTKIFPATKRYLCK